MFKHARVSELFASDTVIRKSQGCCLLVLSIYHVFLWFVSTNITNLPLFESLFYSLHVLKLEQRMTSHIR